MTNTVESIPYASEDFEHPADRWLRRIIALWPMIYGGEALTQTAVGDESPNEVAAPATASLLALSGLAMLSRRRRA
jgi:uncharacterized protein (TIGR03382 family)